MRIALGCLFAVLLSGTEATAAETLSGNYVEARTCQVYTGPCFANGEVGSVGKDAIMTWQVTDGEFDGVDLSGLTVAVVVKASHTMGFRGLDDAELRRAILVLDAKADEQQAAALFDFAIGQTGLSRDAFESVDRAAIDMTFDERTLTSSLDVDGFARLKTRKARPGDCICSNESAYYPPLTELSGFVPGVTIEGDVTARKLGTRWSIPDSRTAYLGTFEVDTSSRRLADSK